VLRHSPGYRCPIVESIISRRTSENRLINLDKCTYLAILRRRGWSASDFVAGSGSHEVGPEHIAIGPDGKLYAAMTSGNLLRLDPDGRKQEVFANTGGRVLGFDFDAQGRMIAADPMRGLLAITADARDCAHRSGEPR
jgi:hypothetical protein